MNTFKSLAEWWSSDENLPVLLQGPLCVRGTRTTTRFTQEFLDEIEIEEFEHVQFTNSDNKLDEVLVPTVIRHGDLKFYKMNEISRGTFGRVYDFRSSNGQRLAVKSFFVFDDEIRLMYDVVHNCMPFRLLGSIKLFWKKRLVGYTNQFTPLACNVMEHMDGSCKDLMNSLDELSCVKIVHSIAVSLRCLLHHNLFYLDMKPHNILYKHMEEDGNCFYKIYLGDLGSICKPRNTGVATFPPPYTYDASEVAPTERNVTFGLFVMAGLFMNVPHDSWEKLLLWRRYPERIQDLDAFMKNIEDVKLEKLVELSEEFMWSETFKRFLFEYAYNGTLDKAIAYLETMYKL